MSNTSLTLHWMNQLNPVANLKQYIDLVFSYPILTFNEEQDLAKRFKYQNDVNAAHQLIMSHLRFVVSIARKYDGYNLPMADLIQEGNIGLMKAVKNFDYTQNFRLSSFAIKWIKSEILNYIINNWRIVKIATSKAKRKLFFNLNQLKSQLRQLSLTDNHYHKIADHLNVPVDEVYEMDRRMSGVEMSINMQDEHDNPDEEVYYAQRWLADDRYDPATISSNEDIFDKVDHAIKQLPARMQRIIQNRFFDDTKLTLQELGLELGVSCERVRQLEQEAITKLKQFLK